MAKSKAIGKAAATQLALKEQISWGHLAEMVETARREADGKTSNVNPSLQLARVCEIYAACCEQHPPEEIPKASRLDPYTHRQKPSRDLPLVVNILRDCGTADGLAARLSREEPHA